MINREDEPKQKSQCKDNLKSLLDQDKKQGVRSESPKQLKSTSRESGEICEKSNRQSHV